MARRAWVVSAIAGWLLAAPAAHAAGVAVVGIELTDDGDHDGYADTNETVELRLTVRVPGAGLDRPVRWVAVSELEDPGPYLEGGELLLTTGMRLPARSAAVAPFIALRGGLSAAGRLRLTAAESSLAASGLLSLTLARLLTWLLALAVPLAG